jgi:hypothetical protein
VTIEVGFDLNRSAFRIIFALTTESKDKLYFSARTDAAAEVGSSWRMGGVSRQATNAAGTQT